MPYAHSYPGTPTGVYTVDFLIWRFPNLASVKCIVNFRINGTFCSVNQRQMRVWHLAESTLNARMAFSGRELRFPTIIVSCRDSEIAPTEEM